MPSMNAIRLANAQSTLPFVSAAQNIQAVREEAVTFWVFVSALDGSKCEIKVAPDSGARSLGGFDGMVAHTIITSGTAGVGQTKVDGNGFASVTIQAHPVMFIRLSGGLGSSAWTVYLIE